MMHFLMTISKWTAPSPAWWPHYISWKKNEVISELHVAATCVLSPLTPLQVVWVFWFTHCRLRPVARFTFGTPLHSLEVSSVGNEWTLRRKHEFCSGETDCCRAGTSRVTKQNPQWVFSQLDLAQYRLFNSAHKQFLNSEGRGWMHNCRALNCLK
jgi:hypothetical protein